MKQSNSPLKVLTWHVHGSYLYYLTQIPCEFYLPVGLDRSGYGGRAGTFPWGENVHEIHVDDIKKQKFDIILFQSKQNYLHDQHEILTAEQRRLPKIYIEHDPPREHPTDTKHIVDDPDVLLVHVTHFNNLMWDNNHTPTAIIDHGVIIPEGITFTGKKNRGVTVINNLFSRGRRLGLDIFKQVQKEIPIDLVGINAEEAGGIGEIEPHNIPAFISEYRFFFYPVRYTSLGLALCEAMTVGMPIVGMATTELVTVIQNNKNGYISTNVDDLIPVMKNLLENESLAKQWGKEAKKTAQERFHIDRFCRDWLNLFKEVDYKHKNEIHYGHTDIQMPYRNDFSYSTKIH